MRIRKTLMLTAVIVAALVPLGSPLAAGRSLLAEVPEQPNSPSKSGQSAHEGMPGMQHEGQAMKMNDMAGGDHTMTMPGGEGSILFSDKQWSEFNHRGAGWFLFFWGITALVAGLQSARKTWWHFAPALVLLGLVEFLFIRNDPEAWPTGSIGLWASLSDPEVFQHRVFVLLLLAMAVVELLRAANRLPPFFAKYSLPGLAVLGGIYLFFHKHGGAEMQQMAQQMADPAIASSPAMKAMMASMDTVKREHLWFSIFGFGLAGARVLADGGWLKGRLGATLWTIFAIVLGVYMMGYVE